jgi:beta-lactamase class A
MKNKIIIYSLSAVLFAGLGFLLRGPSERIQTVIKNNNLNQSEYQYINPTVIADVGKHFIINFLPLRDKIQEIKDKYPQKTYVYFSYLNNGSWIGNGERDNFAAASLAKVPLSIALYKAAEEGKISLFQEYTIEELDLNSNFGELYKSGSGDTYTIEQLIQIMLEQSDNTALIALSRILERIGISNPYDEVYQAFGWVLDMDQSVNANEINLKTLSNMFLALYNSKYLSLENSDKVLKYLANSRFDEKIVSGLPENIPVSHKIGISGGNMTFSDCGIIYAPQRHYLLCVGSNGAGEQMANKFMTEVSREVYNYVITN